MFQFYFQSGEFVGEGGGSFWSDLGVQIIGTSVGAILAALFALYLYNYQVQKQEKIDRAKERRVDFEKLVYINSLFISCIKFTDTLICSLSKSILEFHKDRFRVYDISSRLVNDVSRLSSGIDREGHFHSYRRIFDDRKLLDIYESIDMIHFSYESLRKEWDRATNYVVEKRQIIFDGKDELNELIASYLSKTDKESDLSSQIKIIYNSYQSLQFLRLTESAQPKSLSLNDLNEVLFVPLHRLTYSEGAQWKNEEKQIVDIARKGYNSLSLIHSSNLHLIAEMKEILVKLSQNNSLLKFGVFELSHRRGIMEMDKEPEQESIFSSILHDFYSLIKPNSPGRNEHVSVSSTLTSDELTELKAISIINLQNEGIVFNEEDLTKCKVNRTDIETVMKKYYS